MVFMGICGGGGHVLFCWGLWYICGILWEFVVSMWYLWNLWKVFGILWNICGILGGIFGGVLWDLWKLHGLLWKIEEFVWYFVGVCGNYRVFVDIMWKFCLVCGMCGILWEFVDIVWYFVGVVGIVCYFMEICGCYVAVCGIFW